MWQVQAARPGKKDTWISLVGHCCCIVPGCMRSDRKQESPLTTMTQFGVLAFCRCTDGPDSENHLCSCLLSRWSQTCQGTPVGPCSCTSRQQHNSPHRSAVPHRCEAGIGLTACPQWYAPHCFIASIMFCSPAVKFRSYAKLARSAKVVHARSLLLTALATLPNEGVLGSHRC